MIAAKLAATGNGHTYALDFAGGRHFLSIPLEIAFGSAIAAGKKASMAIAASFRLCLPSLRPRCMPGSKQRRFVRYPWPQYFVRGSGRTPCLHIPLGSAFDA